jgi:hypothetical protein
MLLHLCLIILKTSSLNLVLGGPETSATKRISFAKTLTKAAPG